MRWALGLVAAWLIVGVGSASAGPQRLGVIWQHGNRAIVVTECPPGGDHDEWCRSVAVRVGSETRRLGSGYLAVSILQQGGRNRPDVLVLGDMGGSGSDGSLFAVTFAPRLSVRQLSGERIGSVVTQPRSQPFAFNLPFNIEYFNNAPHAGVVIVPIPISWTGGDFALDMATLTHRQMSRKTMDRRAMMIRRDFDRWVADVGPTSRLYPPQPAYGTSGAAHALTELILSGHADQARRLLHERWPRGSGGRRLGGEVAFWSGLCHAIVEHPWWSRFRMKRLPHADLVLVGAAGFVPDR